ncbi:MAG: hypothetical protein EOM20_03100 [Spartobacteria bacterium]|nr:hypothetical protein [Spartobacteria bacterium]
MNILGIDYTHIEIAGQGDLYITPFGLPFRDQLLPENWHEKEWFREQRVPLEGTSTIYHTKSKPVRGLSKDLVVKWCRVGTVIPVDTFSFQEFAAGEFNSPYEEFSLVMEMRNQKGEGRIRTHKPLAIYSPLKKVELWQTGRSKTRIEQKKRKYRDVELDIYRQYILIYEWIKGQSAVELCRLYAVPDEECIAFQKAITERAVADLQNKGYRVLDMKPAHVIVRPKPERDMLRDKNGNAVYALVDFELLERTPAHELQVLQARRSDYLVRQRDRFGDVPEKTFPKHLYPVHIGGIDYVYGTSESTHGEMWVVGRDPSLFDFFQPERWRRTERTQLSGVNDVYYTRSKDLINLVWKISRVGEIPDIDSSHPGYEAIMHFGYNAPFEEFQIAVELSLLGLPTIYARAIYMSGREAEDSFYAPDQSRYNAFKDNLTPKGQSVLRHNHTYITIWGYWNGLDEFLARKDSEYCKGINADEALRRELISAHVHRGLCDKVAYRLKLLGYNDLNFKGSHFLLSLAPNGKLMLDPDGLPSFRVSNFSLIHKTH